MHDNAGTVSDDHLPWAKTVMPPTSASANGVGMSPMGLQKGSKVFGMWLDLDKTIPMILGSLHADKTSANGVNDVNSITRTNSANGGIDQTFKNTNQKNDVSTATDSFLPIKPLDGKVTYPNGFSWKSPTGDEILINTTKGNECIRVISSTGSLMELTSDKRFVIKAQSSFNTAAMGDATEFVGGNQVVEIKGNCTIHVAGNVTYNFDGNVEYNIKGNLTTNVNGATVLNTQGATTVESGGDLNLGSTGKIEINAPAQSLTLKGSPVMSTPIVII